MEVGLDNRIFEMAVKYEEFQDFYKNLMTKRYTNGRIQRVLIHILLKIDKKSIDETKDGITYIKILGFSEKGGRYLKEKKECLKIKPLSGLKNVSLILDERERKLLNFEIKCDRIYGIINPYEERKFPIIIRESIDERIYVKKAVNWALRSIGKRNIDLNKKAILVSQSLLESNSKSAQWIAKDALREFNKPNLNILDYPRSIYRIN